MNSFGNGIPSQYTSSQTNGKKKRATMAAAVVLVFLVYSSPPTLILPNVQPADFVLGRVMHLGQSLGETLRRL